MHKNQLRPTNLDTIFTDRRQLSAQAANKSLQPCRRKTFAQSTETSWWLKVNYVSQHLHAVDDQHQQKSD